jgi:hypothetical protein
MLLRKHAMTAAGGEVIKRIPDYAVASAKREA